MKLPSPSITNIAVPSKPCPPIFWFSAATAALTVSLISVVFPLKIVRWHSGARALHWIQVMSTGPMKIKSTVAALLAVVMFSIPAGPAPAQSRAAELLRELGAAADATAAQRLERQIVDEWSKSGSPAMDLLLKRGRDALEVEKFEAAAEHFRALTDHAPDFAEGWHGLALAYYQLEMFGPAMDALERTLALNPHHFAALRGVGAIHEQTGKPALAYDAYERVLRLRPHDAEVEKALERLEREVKGVAL